MSRSYRKPYSNGNSQRISKKISNKKVRRANSVLCEGCDEDTEFVTNLVIGWDRPDKEEFLGSREKYLKDNSGALNPPSWWEWLKDTSGQLLSGMKIPVLAHFPDYPLTSYEEYWEECIRK